MNSVPRETPTPARSGEDLDVVLGRFQSWAQARIGSAAVEPGKGDGRPRKVKPGVKSRSGGALAPTREWPGAREISYEQALRASGYRRAAVLPVEPGASPTPLPEPASPRELAVETTEAPPPKASSAAKPTSGGVRAKARRRATPKAASAEAIVPVPFRDVLMATAASAPKPARLAVPAQLAACATQALSAPMDRGKSAALTLRVSDSEQALIQASAARAKLSVSAYLRQCALGVEELRDQVEVALAEIHRRETEPAPPPPAQAGIDAIPGIVAHFALRCLRRLGGRSEGTASLSIR